MQVGVGVVVHDRDGRTLLGRREKTGEPPSWSLPGGTLEQGESFEQAARRELAEETGLDADTVTVLGLGLTTLDGSGTLGWTAAVVADEVAGDPTVGAVHEFTRLEWFAAHESPEPLFGPTRFVLDMLAGRSSSATAASYTLRAVEPGT